MWSQTRHIEHLLYRKAATQDDIDEEFEFFGNRDVFTINMIHLSQTASSVESMACLVDNLKDFFEYFKSTKTKYSTVGEKFSKYVQVWNQTKHDNRFIYAYLTFLYIGIVCVVRSRHAERDKSIVLIVEETLLKNEKLTGDEMEILTILNSEEVVKKNLVLQYFLIGIASLCFDKASYFKNLIEGIPNSVKPHTFFDYKCIKPEVSFGNPHINVVKHIIFKIGEVENVHIIAQGIVESQLKTTDFTKITRFTESQVYTIVKYIAGIAAFSQAVRVAFFSGGAAAAAPVAAAAAPAADAPETEAEKAAADAEEAAADAEEDGGGLDTTPWYDPLNVAENYGEFMEWIGPQVSATITDLSKIDPRVAGLQTNVAGLQTDVAGLQGDYSDVLSHVESIETLIGMALAASMVPLLGTIRAATKGVEAAAVESTIFTYQDMITYLKTNQYVFVFKLQESITVNTRWFSALQSVLNVPGMLYILRE